MVLGSMTSGISVCSRIGWISRKSLGLSLRPSLVPEEGLGARQSGEIAWGGESGRLQRPPPRQMHR
jgi:hypothetical protein